MKKKKQTPEEIFVQKLSSLIKFNTGAFVDYYEGRCDECPDEIAKDIFKRLPDLILPYKIKFSKVKVKPSKENNV